MTNDTIILSTKNALLGNIITKDSFGGVSGIKLGYDEIASSVSAGRGFPGWDYGSSRYGYKYNLQSALNYFKVGGSENLLKLYIIPEVTGVLGDKYDAYGQFWENRKVYFGTILDVGEFQGETNIPLRFFYDYSYNIETKSFRYANQKESIPIIDSNSFLNKDPFSARPQRTTKPHKRPQNVRFRIENKLSQIFYPYFTFSYNIELKITTKCGEETIQIPAFVRPSKSSNKFCYPSREIILMLPEFPTIIRARASLKDQDIKALPTAKSFQDGSLQIHTHKAKWDNSVSSLNRCLRLAHSDSDPENTIENRLDQIYQSWNIVYSPIIETNSKEEIIADEDGRKNIQILYSEPLNDGGKRDNILIKTNQRIPKNWKRIKIVDHSLERANGIWKYEPLDRINNNNEYILLDSIWPIVNGENKPFIDTNDEYEYTGGSLVRYTEDSTLLSDLIVSSRDKSKQGLKPEILDILKSTIYECIKTKIIYLQKNNYKQLNNELDFMIKKLNFDDSDESKAKVKNFKKLLNENCNNKKIIVNKIIKNPRDFLTESLLPFEHPMLDKAGINLPNDDHLHLSDQNNLILKYGLDINWGFQNPDDVFNENTWEDREMPLEKSIFIIYPDLNVHQYDDKKNVIVNYKDFINP